MTTREQPSLRFRFFTSDTAEAPAASVVAARPSGIVPRMERTEGVLVDPDAEPPRSRRSANRLTARAEWLREELEAADRSTDAA